MQSAKKRPLSPHLQVYRWQITNTLSILHRLTGIGLYFSFILLVTWLGSLAYGESCYQEFISMLESAFGQAILLFSLLGFYYHFANGIRHLTWDAGYGFSIKAVTVTGWMAVVFAVAATFVSWMIIQ